MRKVSVFAVALAIALLATAAWGQYNPGAPGDANRPNRPGGGGMGGMGRGGGFSTAMAVMPPQPMFFERNAEELQLTEDQKTKLKDVMMKSEQSMVPLMQKANKASTALRTGLLSADSDAAKIKTLVSDAQKAEADIVTARLDTWAKMKAELKPEQLAKMQDLMTRRPGPGGPGGPGVPPGPGAPPPPPPPADGGGGPPPPAPPAQ